MIENDDILEMPFGDELDEDLMGNPETFDIEKRLIQLDKDTHSIPMLCCRDLVLFPGNPISVPVGRDISKKAVLEALKKDKLLLCVCQKEADMENPGMKDLYTVGTLAGVFKVIDLPNGDKAALVYGIKPAKLTKIISRKSYYKVNAEMLYEECGDTTREELDSLLNLVEAKFDRLLSNMGDETEWIRTASREIESGPLRLNFMLTYAPMSSKDKVECLECLEVKKRMIIFLQKLDLMLKMQELQKEISEKTKEALNQQQREHFLQQQISTIQQELGADDLAEIDELKERAARKNWPEKVKKIFDREVIKLERYNPSTPDYGVQFTYLETLLGLPWDDYSTDNFSLEKVEKILNHDHYGLETVKERIIEQMAVIKLRNDLKAPIICLFGPPGVGKTSLGKSIADALGREYCRISLGGLHDEAEIRGHRRTYIGALPGRIITALGKCKTNNPVFVLDEIDKIGSDFKGDPSTALLEVLDPEQNNKFHDNYLNVDYDLSHVLFIATANSLSTISRPLLDRMEIIEIDGYITAEKVEIAAKHLIPKLLKDNGLEPKEISFSKAALTYIVDRYTRESGVRGLEKKISKVLRKLARLKASGQPYDTKVTPQLVRKLLGAEEVTPEEYENNDFIGVVTGLAWTSVGGEILFIESSLSEGKEGKLTLTGNLGDVMKESAVIAKEYLKSHASKYGIDPQLFTTRDIHIHVPEGAIPKDGPSAGITMVTSLASSFTGKKVRPRLAMTGEITLRGKVLPVGGIKEKILAAKRAGITDIILSSQNRKNIEEIAERYLKNLTFHYVDTIDQVLDFALLEK